MGRDLAEREALRLGDYGVPSMRLTLALATFASIAASATAASAQRATDDYSDQVVHIHIASSCGSYTWPVTTTPGGVAATKWQGIAVQEICRQYPQTALAFDVRGDGRMIALNHVDFFNEDRFFADTYRGATFLGSPVHVTVDGTGKLTITPKGIDRDAPNAAAELASLRREVQFLAGQGYVKPSDLVIDATIGADLSLAWSGSADPHQDAARQTAAELCLRQLWDLPFERQVICAARAALVALAPRR